MTLVTKKVLTTGKYWFASFNTWAYEDISASKIWLFMAS